MVSDPDLDVLDFDKLICRAPCRSLKVQQFMQHAGAKTATTMPFPRGRGRERFREDSNVECSDSSGCIEAPHAKSYKPYVVASTDFFCLARSRL